MRNYFHWDKNLCHIPLARDAHFRPKWHFSKKYNRWWCYLPALKKKAKVRLRLPADTPKAERRAPTPFDMNALWLIIRKARMRSTNSAWFANRTEILKQLGVSISTANRTKLDAALTLWNRLSILRERWFWGKDVRKHRTLPPPITTLRHDAKGIFVKLHSDWLGPPPRRRGYFATAPFPLPMTAREQNLILIVAPWRTSPDKDGEHNFKQKHAFNIRELCLRIGLAHDQAAYMLRKRVLPATNKWLEQHGLGLDAVWARGARHGWLRFFKL